jgi:hypothetical protein
MQKADVLKELQNLDPSQSGHSLPKIISRHCCNPYY